VELTEMVSVVILPSEGSNSSVAFRVITRETVFLPGVGVDVLVMTLEIGRPTENVLFSWTTPWILTGIFSFL
jgi:hypothetical protein